MPLCTKITIYRLDESEVTSIDASEMTPSGCFENVLENLFEMEGIPGHLLKPFKDLGGRDGAWAKLCEQITTAAPLDRPAKVQTMLNAALNWSPCDPEKWINAIKIKDGSIHQDPLELVVDLVPGNRHVSVGSLCFITREPNVVQAAKARMLHPDTMKRFESSQVPDARWEFVLTFQWPAEETDEFDLCQETFIVPKPKSEQLYTAAKMALFRMCDLCREAADNRCKQSEEPRAWGTLLPYVPTKLSEQLRGCEEFFTRIRPGIRFYPVCTIHGDDSLSAVLKCFGCLVVDQLPDELRVIAESGPCEADREACKRIFEYLGYGERDSAEISRSLTPRILAMVRSNAPEDNDYRVLPVVFDFDSCHALKHFRGNVNSQEMCYDIFKLPPEFRHVRGPGSCSSLYRRCYGCGDIRRLDGKQRFKICANCKEACYCSRECQKVHWPTHKAVCKKTGCE